MSLHSGFRDARLIGAMRESDQDISQHKQWWMGMNNGMSKCWLMQVIQVFAHVQWLKG